MNRFYKNWAYLLFSDVTNSIINFFIFMMLARKLSPEGYGEFNVILSLVSLFSVFALGGGANQVITREIAVHPEATQNLVIKLMSLRFISFTVTVIAFFAYSFYLEVGRINVIGFSILLVLSNSIWDIAESVAFGHFITKYTTAFNIITSLLWLTIIGFLPADLTNPETVLFSYMVLYLMRSCLYFLLSYRKYVKSNATALSIGVKNLIIMSLPYLWMRTLGSFTDQIPILLLKALSGAAEVGYYAVGYRFVIPITLAISTGLRAMFPFLAKLYHENRVAFNERIVEGFSFVLIWGGTFATLLVTISAWFIPTFLGDSYETAVGAFSYLAWFGIVMCFDSLLSVVLSSSYKQNTLAIITSIDVVLLFPLLYWGSRYGAEGLSLMRLVGGILLISYHIIVVIKVLKIKINSFCFQASCLYVILLMCTSIFVTAMPMKLLMIFLVLLVYLSIKKSPLRKSIGQLLFLIKDMKKTV